MFPQSRLSGGTGAYQPSYYDLAMQYAQKMHAANAGGYSVAEKHNVVPIPQNIVPAQGPGGVFGGPMEPGVFNAMVLPASGLMQMLPQRRSLRSTIAYSIISGVTSTIAADGSAGPVEEPNGTCDDPPQAGLFQICTFAAPWGRWSRQSRVVDISTLGDTEYCDTPLELIGGPEGHVLSPQGWDTINNDVLRSTPRKALTELGVSFIRDFAPIAFTGNPANNTAGGGYKEFNGIERLINTGYTDMISGQPCPAANSMVRDLVADIGLTSPDADPQLFIAVIRDIYNSQKHLAEAAGLAPVRGAFVMPRWMFDGIVRLWACAYLTDRCGATTQNVFSTSTDWIQFRDSMLQNRYLLIDGEAVPVIIDEAQPYVKNADGTYTGTLFFVPFTVLGGIPVFYQQYKPFNNDEIQTAIQMFAPQGFFRVAPSPNGAFLIVSKAPQNTCLQILGITQRRLVLHTPYLAFRIDNITLNRHAAYRHWDPANPDFVTGGRTTPTG